MVLVTIVTEIARNVRREQRSLPDQVGTDMDGVGAFAQFDVDGNHTAHYDAGCLATPAISSCIRTILTSPLTEGRPVSITKCAHSR